MRKHSLLTHQSIDRCCAGSRVFVEDRIYDEFVEKCAARASRAIVGPTMNPDTELGPVISQGVKKIHHHFLSTSHVLFAFHAEQFDRVMGYIELGKKSGARLMCGGKRLGDKGFFIEATVFADVKDEDVIAREVHVSLLFLVCLYVGKVCVCVCVFI